MSTPLFGIILGPTVVDAYDLFEANREFIDGIELRLDAFSRIDLQELYTFVRHVAMPVIFTVRTQAHGGYFCGPESDRLSLIEQLCALSPSYIDLEYGVPTHFIKRLKARFPKIGVISSYHNLDKTPKDLDALISSITTPYTQFIKIAVYANSFSDVVQMLLFVSRNQFLGSKCIGISLGIKGTWARLLAPLFSIPFAYAPLNQIDTVLGQITAQEMQKTYHFRHLNPYTQLYALIGNPIAQSIGAIFHNREFVKAQYNALYIKIPLEIEELSDFFSAVHLLPFKGCSVTMPYKEAVLPFLKENVDHITQAIGACNTIQIEKGECRGFNTDGIAALDAIEERCPVEGQQVVIVGAGGAGKAIAWEAIQRGAHVTLLNRSYQKTIPFAQKYECASGDFSLFPVLVKKGYDVLISTLPDSNIIDPEWIIPNRTIMDIIYQPRDTPLLKRAVQKGCHIVYGEEMFLRQAQAQQNRWRTPINSTL